jgi:aspartokinase
VDPKPNGIEIVAVRDVPLAIEIRDPKMISETGFIEKIGTFCSEHGISIDQMATSEGSVTLTFTKDIDDATLRELRENIDEELPATITVSRNLAAIFCLGNNMKRPGVMSEATLALNVAEADIHIATQGKNESVMTFIVDPEKMDEAAKAIHEFCVLLPKEQRDAIMSSATEQVRGVIIKR